MDCVLDIDLDFFVHVDGRLRVTPGARLAGAAEVAPKAWVTHFLERSFGLCPFRPVVGDCFSEHVEAYLFWNHLVEIGQLKSPFHLVHVDAHSDMGYGPNFYRFVTEDLWDRRNPPGSDDFVLHALADGLIADLTYVRQSSDSRLDVPPILTSWETPDTGHIQLMRLTQDQLREALFEGVKDVGEPVSSPVPFRCPSWADFRCETPVTVMTLACSPAYTPGSADGLVPTISRYFLKPLRRAEHPGCT